MECRQEIFGRRVSLPSRLLTVFISALLLAGCTESTSTPDVASESSEIGAIQVSPIDDTGGSPPTELSADDELVDSPGEVKYPSDNEGDDPVSMILTGLNELDPSHVVSPWLVSVRLFRSASAASNTGDVSMELTRYAEDFPVSAHIRFFTEPLDTCVIRNSDNEEGADRSNPPPPGIDGGETVVLNGPSGTWLSLERTQMSDEPLGYRAQEQLPGMLPASTTLSIPGGAFPTVGTYPLFEPVPVVRLLPAVSQPVTAESRFSWVPLNQPGYVKIDFMAYDETDDFQDFPASCWVIDDGSFDLPGKVQEALEPIEMQAGSSSRWAVRYSRIYSRVDLIDGIVFHQGMEVAE